MRPPAVYAAINAVAAGIAQAGLPKRNFNLRDDYFYRSIDDVLSCLSPVLARHQLCVLPRVLKREALQEREGKALWTRVTIKVAFDLVSAEDGSRHCVRAYGEAIDEHDKATAKAMSAAYKSAMVQTFSIPVAGADDPDCVAVAPPRGHDPAPVEGWDQWSAGIIDLIKGCQSKDALSRVQDTYRGQLKSLQREQSGLYAAIGAAFALRQRAIAENSADVVGSAHAAQRKAHRPRVRAKAEEATDA